MKYFKTVLIALLIPLSLVATTVAAKNPKNFDVGRNRSVLISEGAVFVAGYNQYNVFGAAISNLYSFVEYGDFNNAVSAEVEGARLAVLTNTGSLTLQGLWVDGMELMASDAVDFALSFQRLVILHADGSLTSIELDRESVNLAIPLSVPYTVAYLEGGYNNIAIVTDADELYLDERFVAAGVEMVAVGRNSSIYKTYSGEVYVVDNITLALALLGSDTGIVNVSIGKSDMYVHYNDGRVFAKGWHNIIANGVYNNSVKLTEITHLFGVDSIQSSSSHRLAIKGLDVYAWAQNAFGEHGVSTGTQVETHKIAYVTTLIEPASAACITHNNGKNTHGNQKNYCAVGFDKGKGHHK
ncbi:MAG: hypothetical protein GQ581_01965 [Methyloprofundus sp.]|nr:hypothetical protein [Methyloprofundus sp.]